MIDPRTLATQGYLDGPSGYVLQGFFRRPRGAQWHDLHSVSIHGFLFGNRHTALQGFSRRQTGPHWHHPLSVLIQGTLFGPRHTALQGFTKYAPLQRKRIAATMPNFMRHRTRFRF